MKPLQLFYVALTSTALLACQEDATQPRQDVSLLGTYAVLAPTSTINATAPVHLHPPAGEVTTTQSVSGSANVAMKFLSVEQACLVFGFSGDLLDPGDELFITVDATDAGSFFNPGSEPEPTRTFCWVATLHPTIVAEFMDGKAKLNFTAGSGSVTLGSVTLTISGSPRREQPDN